MKRLLSIGAIVSLMAVSGCASLMQNSLPPSRVIYPIQSAKELEASGNLNLTIHLGSPLNRVTVFGEEALLSESEGVLSIQPNYSSREVNNVTVDIRTLNQLQLSDLSHVKITSERDQMVDISAENVDQVELTGPMTVPNLYVNNVKRFTINRKVQINNLQLLGDGVFKANDVYSNALNFDKDGSGTAKIRGYVALAHLTQQGSGSVDLYFIKGNKTTINLTDSTVTKLGGYTKKLIVNADKSAKLDASFLRADNVYVRAFGNATATVFANGYLFADTTGPSRIDYFGQPKHIYKESGRQGIILPGKR